MLADIEAKSKYVSELLQKKEELEVEMAPAGVVNFIYVSLPSFLLRMLIFNKF